MNSLIVKKHFLSKELIDETMKIVNDNLSNNVWKTNSSWDEDLVGKGSKVFILNLVNYDKIREKLDSAFKQSNILPKDYIFISNLYLWQTGSHITFHSDSVYDASCTIYLNEFWDRNWGGLFLWEDENKKIHAEAPEFNKMVFNPKNILHAVSMIAPTAEAPRISIQCFFKF